jgi:hypothetical protein
MKQINITCPQVATGIMEIFLPFKFLKGTFTHTHTYWSYMNLRVTECYIPTRLAKISKFPNNFE